MEVCQQKMRQIIAKDKEATAVEQDMLTTLEVCYEFYLRGFTFTRMDLYKSEAIRFVMDEEKGTLTPPFVSVAGLGETAAISLAEQRKGRSFISIEEVSAACPKVSKTHIELLKDAGAFGDLPETSQINLFSMFE
jgi:DNA polymerase-3 subunit alpha (Gram-positive type)